MSDELWSSGSEREVLMDLRKSPRIGVHSRSFFEGGPIDSEGTMVDLSTTGCRIVSDTSVQPGTVLKVSVYLPDHGWPLKVQLAEVRWTWGLAFGLEFLSVPSEDRQRLDRVLQAKQSLLVPAGFWR